MSSRKPNLFIVGAAKSGTSSLATYLAQHPDIFVSGIKEPAYYVKDAGYDDWGEYLSLFAGRKELVLCDASTGYLYENTTAKDIALNHPGARILIMLRNPIDMAFSYWQYMQVDGNESCAFLESISDKQREIRRTDKFKHACKNWWCSYLYLERAMYFRQVKRYIDTFGRENVQIHIFEEFIKDPKETLQSILMFLGLPLYDDFNTDRIENTGGKIRSKFLRDLVYHKEYAVLRKIFPPKLREQIRFFVRDINRQAVKEKITDSTRLELKNLFSDDVGALKELINSDILSWHDFRD